MGTDDTAAAACAMDEEAEEEGPEESEAEGGGGGADVSFWASSIDLEVAAVETAAEIVSADADEAVDSPPTGGRGGGSGGASHCVVRDDDIEDPMVENLCDRESKRQIPWVMSQRTRY